MAQKQSKHMNFAFILYPESLPENWTEKLEKLGVPIAISPLHDKDKREIKDIENVIADNRYSMSEAEKEKYRKENVYKKAHYHVMYCNRNPVTIQSVRNKINRILGTEDSKNLVSHLEVVDHVEGYFLYLSHESKDAKAKNKHVYDSKDIVFLNDFDIDRYIKLDEYQKKEMLNAILQAVRENTLANIFELSDYIESHGSEIGVANMNVVNDIIKGNTGLLRLYFDGAYQQRNNKR